MKSSDLLVLDYIKVHPGSSNKGIVEGTGLSAQTVSRALMRLRKESKIYDEYVAKDGRPFAHQWKARVTVGTVTKVSVETVSFCGRKYELTAKQIMAINNLAEVFSESNKAI